MPDRDLGNIALLQVQRDPLKAKGEGYDPTPLLAVAEASIDAMGMSGRHGDGWVLDAHHAAHPRSRGRGVRPLSIGFAGHYAAMAERFGPAELGCGGENIILDTPGRVTGSDLSGAIVIHTVEGEVVVRNAGVAAPCAEFTSFLKGLDRVLPKREQADDVDFLDGGTRGFILDVSGLGTPATIRVGDRVSVRAT
jgi:hypothetical protein